MRLPAASGVRGLAPVPSLGPQAARLRLSLPPPFSPLARQRPPFCVLCVLCGQTPFGLPSFPRVSSLSPARQRPTFSTFHLFNFSPFQLFNFSTAPPPAPWRVSAPLPSSIRRFVDSSSRFVASSARRFVVSVVSLVSPPPSPHSSRNSRSMTMQTSGSCPSLVSSAGTDSSKSASGAFSMASIPTGPSIQANGTGSEVWSRQATGVR